MSESKARRERIERTTLRAIRWIAWILGVALTLLGLWIIAQNARGPNVVQISRGIAAVVMGAIILQYVLRRRA